MRIFLFVTAGLLTALALFLFFAPPKITLDADTDEVVVSCDAVAGIGDGSRELEGANSRSYTFEVVAGEQALQDLEDVHTSQLEHVGPYDITDRIESHCDRLRTGRVAGMALSLAPAALLASIAIAFPSIRRGS